MERLGVRVHVHVHVRRGDRRRGDRRRDDRRVVATAMVTAAMVAAAVTAAMVLHLNQIGSQSDARGRCEWRGLSLNNTRSNESKCGNRREKLTFSTCYFPSIYDERPFISIFRPLAMYS